MSRDQYLTEIAKNKPEISSIEQGSISPYLEHFGDVLERHLWTKNPQQIATFDFLNFMKNSNLGTSWSVICGQKIHSY